jgi:hypothetical protein
MRKRVEVVAEIDQPVERVFGYLSDPCRWHEFSPAVVSRSQIGEGVPGVGTRWVAVDRIGPIKVSFTDELAEFDLNRRVVWTSSAPWNARTEYVCEPTGTGTHVRTIYEGDVDGWLKVLSWAPSSVIGKFLSRDFTRLQARLRTGP